MIASGLSLASVQQLLVAVAAVFMFGTCLALGSPLLIVLRCRTLTKPATTEPAWTRLSEPACWSALPGVEIDDKRYGTSVYYKQGHELKVDAERQSHSLECEQPSPGASFCRMRGSVFWLAGNCALCLS